MAERSDINDRELLASRILRAAPATVFEFWTDPANISEWWGPDGFATTTHAMDLRAGGEWLFTMHGPGGQDYKSRVEFLEVTRPSRLVYLHRDRDELEPVRFHATVTFAALGEKTLLTMRMVFESAEDLARTEDAYGASDGLLRTLARFTESLAAHSQTERVVAPRSDRELATSRTIGAPPERVFDAFRDPEKLARWWGPRGFTNTFHEFDFRPGGAWKLTMHGPDGKDFANELVFTEIDEPWRMVVDHRSKPAYVAEFDLVPAPEGTTIIFYQVLESAEVRKRIAKFAGEANEENVDRLAELLRAPTRAGVAPPQDSNLRPTLGSPVLATEQRHVMVMCATRTRPIIRGGVGTGRGALRRE